MGAQSIKRRRLCGILHGKAHRRCAVACAYVARSPPTGASFPAALGGIQCSIGSFYRALSAKHMYGSRFATKVCVEKRIFRHARLRVSCAMGELSEKEVVFCKVTRKSLTTKSSITLEPLVRFVALLALNSKPTTVYSIPNFQARPSRIQNETFFNSQARPETPIPWARSLRPLALEPESCIGYMALASWRRSICKVSC